MSIKRAADGTDYLRFFRKGESFYFAANFLAGFGSSVVAPATFAYATNLAFACEVYLKVLAHLEHGQSHLMTHDLEALFADLSRASRRAVEREWNKTGRPKVERLNAVAALPAEAPKPATFKEALHVSAQAFVEFRYVTDGRPISFLLSGTPYELRRLILNRRPSWDERVRRDN